MQLQTARQRRLRQRADTRRVILEATEALLVEQGYGGFSMRRLAERCGYSAPTIYHHFGDKTGLIGALLEERFRGFLLRLRRVRLGDDPAENLHKLLGAFVRFGLRNPTHYRLLMDGRPEGAALSPAGEELRAYLLRPLQEMARAGRLREDDVPTAAQALWALVHGLISLRTAHPGHDWRPGLFAVALEATLAGLESRARSDGREGR